MNRGYWLAKYRESWDWSTKKTLQGRLRDFYEICYNLGAPSFDDWKNNKIKW